MPLSLFRLAEEHGIVVERWCFAPPVRALYVRLPGLPPVVGLDHSLFSNRRELRSALAEELGHHFTTTGERLASFDCRYVDRPEISRAEYRALKWAALRLIPKDKLRRALGCGYTELWQLADYLDVTDDLMRVRWHLFLQGRARGTGANAGSSPEGLHPKAPEAPTNQMRC